ncbi:MAG: hypothetical protein ACH350_08845 [Parachlamydiaceae bacterium]
MNNRTLFLMTLLVIVCMLILFGLNMTSLLTGQPPNQTYLKFNHVKGMAVDHNQMLYTLNFEEQNKVIDILNSAVIINEIKSNERIAPKIEKIVIYQFENKPTIVLYPIAYVENNLILSAPDWVPNGYLMELSDGALKDLLSKTYD